MNKTQSFNIDAKLDEVVRSMDKMSKLLIICFFTFFIGIGFILYFYIIFKTPGLAKKCIEVFNNQKIKNNLNEVPYIAYALWCIIPFSIIIYVLAILSQEIFLSTHLPTEDDILTSLLYSILHIMSSVSSLCNLYLLYKFISARSSLKTLLYKKPNT